MATTLIHVADFGALPDGADAGGEPRRALRIAPA